MYQFPKKCEDNIFLIDHEGNQITYLDFKQAQDQFQSNIDSRVVILVLSENTAGAVMGLMSFLFSGQVPLLMESSLRQDFSRRLIETYEIEYLFVDANKRDSYSDFDEVSSIGDHILLKTNIKSKSLLDKNLAILLNTSGSTGSPKLVRLSYDNLISNGQSIVEYLKIDDRDRAITTLPFSYSFGLSIINSHFLAGASIIMTKKSIMERGFWEIFDKHKPTSLSGVPFTFEILRRIGFFSKSPQSSLRYITQAGGKMSNDLILEIDEFSKKHKIDFYVMYGQTEATARISYLKPEFINKKIGSIGKAIPGGSLRIRPINQGVSLEQKNSGELIYTGPNVMMGYAENRSDLGNSDDLGGELITGDIAMVDEEGFYYIVGRKRRFLKIYGKRVNLDEVEELLTKTFYPVACLGSDDNLEIFTSNKSDGQRLKHFVSKEFNLNPLAIRISIVDEFPRLSNGKIDYRYLGEKADG
jgi:acyl-CoA synthetase (AMP-forming)/AMP-acid ligase II